MEANQYQAIKHYLTTSEYLKWIKTEGEKSKWQHKTARMVVIKGQLFYHEKKRQPTLVVLQHQVVAILYMIHDHPTGGHRDPESMSQKICQAYYWKLSLKIVSDMCKLAEYVNFKADPRKITNYILYP